MKKSLFIISLVMMSLTTVTGCDTTKESGSNQDTTSVDENNEAPRIRGKNDFTFSKEEKTIDVQEYNFLGEITAVDTEDGDVTDKVTYKVFDFYTKEEVTTIDLSKDRKYTITYTVVDSKGASDTAQVFIIVGDPNGSLTPSGEPKPNMSDYDYEQVTATYQEVFNQQFNYTGLPGTVEGESDYKAYLYQTGGGGWGNNEVQTYRRDSQANCYVEDGNLRISVTKENGIYYSARLNTTPAFSENWTYGKYEVRAILPTESGTWPAIWMMPNNYYGWPASGEIDIMETSQLYKGRIIGTVHTTAFNWPNNNQKTGSWWGDITEYHTYAIEWLPDRIRFLVDDSCYFQYVPRNYVTTEITNAEWPFDASFHFIFNIAMGGNMGGSFDTNLFNPDGRVSMYIDWIKVSQSTYIEENFKF